MKKKIKKIYVLIFTLILFSTLSSIAQEYAKIPHISDKIIIDGIADEVWNNVLEHQITYLIDGTSYPSPSDLSGYFKAFWNNDTLYVLVHAVDNILYTSDPTVYYNDGFEIYLDVVNMKDTVFNDSCYQFRFIPGSTEITGRWGLDYKPLPAIDFAINVEANNNRTIEAVFPIMQLGRKTHLDVGSKIGFEVELLDNDGNGRNHVLSWNNNLHMAWYNPSKMGTIELVESTTGIDYKQIQDISITPNPASDYILVKSLISINELSIYSIQGQLLYKKTGIQTTEISLNISRYQPGMYLMKAKLANNKYLNYKILKK
jgi:Carbohydrate family 9 binding domain-like/Secretion system C-terminal sorting domain